MEGRGEGRTRGGLLSLFARDTHGYHMAYRAADTCKLCPSSFINRRELEKILRDFSSALFIVATECYAKRWRKTSSDDCRQDLKQHADGSVYTVGRREMTWHQLLSLLTSFSLQGIVEEWDAVTFLEELSAAASARAICSGLVLSASASGLFSKVVHPCTVRATLTRAAIV